MHAAEGPAFDAFLLSDLEPLDWSDRWTLLVVRIFYSPSASFGDFLDPQASRDLSPTSAPLERAGVVKIPSKRRPATSTTSPDG